MMTRRDVKPAVLHAVYALYDAFSAEECELLFKNEAFKKAFAAAENVNDFEELGKAGWVLLFEAEFPENANVPPRGLR